METVKSVNREGVREDAFLEFKIPRRTLLWFTVCGGFIDSLLRKIIAGFYCLQHDIVDVIGSKVKVIGVLISQFLNGNQQYLYLCVPASSNNVDKNLRKNDNPFPSTMTNVRRKSFLSGGYDEGFKYRKALDSLPELFRSAMVLSYLDGFSNGEVAELVGIQPQTIKLLLCRGHDILREELLECLMGDGDPGPATESTP